MTLGEVVDEYLEMHQAEPVTIAKLRWLLGKATATLGELRLVELSPKDVYAWRLTVPDGHRFEATHALRQVLNRAVSWGLIDYNPAKRGVPNPVRRSKEKRPFESWQQIGAVAERLGPVYGPMMMFAAATGLRPSELFALEHRDIDRGAGVVYVRRAYANGRIKQTKTQLSTRAVPLQAIALEALDRLPRSENPILFPNAGAATSTSAASAVAAGSRRRRRLASSRCVNSTTYATPTPPSRCEPASRCLPSPATWARALR